MVKKLCNHPGCRTLIEYSESYCEKHKPKPKQDDCDRYENRKLAGGKYFRFYRSTPWRKASRIYRLNHPCCEMCLKEGVIRKADVVDHIQELRTPEGWKLRLSEGNYQVLCHYHHNLKTRAERARRSAL